MSGKSEIKIDRANKVMSIRLWDKFDEEGAIKYAQDYMNNARKIDTSDFTLDFDCCGLLIGTHDSIKPLESCFEMYKQGNFKEITAILYKPQKYLGGLFISIASKLKIDQFSVKYK